MKKIIYLFLIFNFTLISCSDDDDSNETVTPTLSRTEMISRTWVFDEVTHTSTTNTNVTTNVQDVTNSDYEQEFSADGTFEIRNDGQTLSGAWSFINDNTLHTTLDIDPNTIYSSVITDLTSTRFWITNTTSTLDSSGIATITVSEIKHRAK